MKMQSSGGKKVAAGQSGTTRLGSNSCGKTQAEQRLRECKNPRMEEDCRGDGREYRQQGGR